MALTLTYQNFIHCSKPGCTREAYRPKQETVRQGSVLSPAHRPYPAPTLFSHGFPAPVLTEEDGVTPPWKEKNRGGDVRFSRPLCHYQGFSQGPKARAAHTCSSLRSLGLTMDTQSLELVSSR